MIKQRRNIFKTFMPIGEEWIVIRRDIYRETDRQTVIRNQDKGMRLFLKFGTYHHYHLLSITDNSYLHNQCNYLWLTLISVVLMSQKKAVAKVRTELSLSSWRLCSDSSNKWCCNTWLFHSVLESWMLLILCIEGRVIRH